MPGSRGSIGTMNYDLAALHPCEFPGLPMYATGADSIGDRSVIEFGIFHAYIASIQPFTGETDEQVYRALE